MSVVQTSLRRITLPLVLAAVTISFGGTSVRAEDASTAITALPCAAVDPELYTRQQWVPGASPYGIALDRWDQAAFDALKQRMTACMKPSNRKRTLMMLRYLEDPYGPQTQVLRQVDNRNAKAARASGFVDEIRSAMVAAVADPSSKSRHGRLSSVGVKIDTSTLADDQKANLRHELTDRMKDADERDIADAKARDAVAVQQRVADGQAAEAAKAVAEQQNAQEQVEADRLQRDKEARAKEAAEITTHIAAQHQAEAERAHLEAQAQAQVAAAEAETYYRQRLAKLSPSVVAFLTKNPTLKPPQARDAVSTAVTIIDALVFAVDICHTTYEGFGPTWADMQSRMGVLQQVLIEYDAVPPTEIAQAAQDRRANWAKAGLKEQLLSSPTTLQETCESAPAQASSLLDFSR